MAATAHITIDPSAKVASVPRRLFGSFVEHLGRCVYTGIYEPTHPTADEKGFRRDVLDLVRDLGVTTVRYPGGNFVSGYRWEDGIGPVEHRPIRIDPAWHCIETNMVGLDEFMTWASTVGVEPMMAVNLGTRGIQEALDILEYCNVPGGTFWSDQRRANGAADPYKVRMWCLGNEMDGPWQLGAKTATEYGRLASQVAKAMRMIDPTLELVVCGSSGSGMPTFGTWEKEVLTHTYDDVDFVSAHAYYREEDGDRASFLASGIDMDNVIDTVIATCDLIKAQRQQTREIMISFDEWNVWYQNADASKPPTGDDWPQAPHLLEDVYSTTDAVVVGGLLISLLRHSDRVHAACLAQLVNVIAPIMTEPGGPAWKQTIFHPFALTAAHAAGDVIALDLQSGKTPTAQYGDVDSIDATATLNAETGDLCLFLLNRQVSCEADITIDLHAFDTVRVASAVAVTGSDHHMDSHTPDTSAATPSALTTSLDSGALTTRLPAASWSMVVLTTR